MKHPFDDSELLALLEVARNALACGDTFDYCAEKLDISDDRMLVLQDKLTEFLEDTK